MDYTQKLRIKTAMVIYQLELSLGNYVIDNEVIHNISASSLDSIVEREASKGREINKNNLNLIVEASYLDEIFNFAISITEGISLHSDMIELKKLCSILGIFNIRNAVSHPNRPFPDCYWFRVATIASDPLIDRLNLTSVRNALNSAIEENLNTPPDEWLFNVNWAIPNTLPMDFDHEITGLLGRDKEFKDLESVLSKSRNNLVAIVAPGGIGKTALVLQCLKDLSLNPQWSAKLSAIIYCTLKNEKLTAHGNESIDAISGIEQIKESIFEDLKIIYSNKYQLSSFDEALTDLDNENILICIDNLETLLVHSQKEFIEFNQLLPDKWKLLVTSRISIDSATTVTLEPLVKRHAVNLARNYFRKRGVVDFKQDILEKIADAANNNPLAIRLTIDLYLNGRDIISSISKSQKDIASFSYKNLIESLNNNQISLLEAIYSIGQPTRLDLIDFIEIDRDDLSESLNALAKTSLIIRSTDEFGNDVYKLSDSIRDLLLTNPKNIEIRNSISEGLKKRKSKIRGESTRIKQLGLNEFDKEFIPEGIDQSLYVLISDLNKTLGKKNKYDIQDIASIKDRFSKMIMYRAKDSLFLYHYSRIFQKLGDFSNELTYLKKAEETDPQSPKVKLAIAQCYFYNSDYQKAKEYFEILINIGSNIPTNSNIKFSNSVTKLYHSCLLLLGEYDTIIESSKNWKELKHWSGLVGAYRASALNQKIKSKKFTAISSNEVIIAEIFDILNFVFTAENYLDAACVEAKKIIKDLIFIINPNSEYSKDIIHKYLEFVAVHFFNVVSKLRNENLTSAENQNFISNLYDFNIESNPLHEVKWFKKTSEINSRYDIEHLKELKEEGYEIVEVYHIPGRYGMSRYMFAKNDAGQQFYLSVDCFDQGWNRWGYIKEGDCLAIKFAISPTLDKQNPAATEIIEIHKY